MFPVLRASHTHQSGRNKIKLSIYKLPGVQTAQTETKRWVLQREGEKKKGKNRSSMALEKRTSPVVFGWIQVCSEDSATPEGGWVGPGEGRLYLG